MKYQLWFIGRLNNSLGPVSRPVSIVVDADNADLAREKAYDTHEHISGGLDGVQVQALEEKE